MPARDLTPAKEDWPFASDSTVKHLFGVVARFVRNCALERAIQYSRDGSD
jgi:hypothetical protein